MMDQFDQLSCNSDDSDIVAAFLGDTCEECTYRTGRLPQMFGGLDEKPAGFGTALFGDAAIARRVA